MKKKWFTKGVSILLAGCMAFSMAACSGNNAQQEINNEEAKKYVFAYEDVDLGLDGYDSSEIMNVKYVNGKFYIFCTVGNQKEALETKQVLISMNPDGSERTEVEIKQPENDEGAAVGPGEGVLRDLSADTMSAPEVPEDEPAIDLPIVEEPIGNDDMAGQIITRRSYDQMIIGTDNTILCLESVYTDDYTVPEVPVSTQEFNLICFDMDFNEIWRAPLQPYIEGEEWFWVQNFLTDSKGNIYLLSDRKCITFDKDGNNLSAVELETSGMNAFISEQDELLGSVWDNESQGMNVVKVNPKTGKVTETIELLPNINNYNIGAPGLGYDFLLTNNSGIFGYNLGDADVTPVMNFVNSDLNTTWLDSILALDDERFAATYWDNSDNIRHLSIFTPVAPEDIPDKQAIVLGCLYMDWEVRNRVVAFNKSSSEYRITIKDYSVYNTPEDWQAGRNQLNNDILSGNTPDIMVLQRDMPISSFISKGLFADLNEFIDKDEELDRNDYLANVMDVYSVNGKLYQLVPGFSIQTYAAKEKWVGERKTWSMAEMQEILAQMPEGATAFGNISRESMMSMAMMYAGDQFMDLESGKCNFDSPEFIDLLNYIKTLPAEKDLQSDGDWVGWSEDYETQWREDRTLLFGNTLYSVWEFHRQMKGYIGEDYAFVGYPSAPKQGSLINPLYDFAISSKSACKDGAWEFLRYYLTDEYQDSIEWGLPLKEEALRNLAMKATEKPYWLDEAGNKIEYDDMFYIGGMEIPIEPMTEAEVEAILTFIKSVDRTMNYDTEISNIIDEEAAPFFEGQKPVEEVVKIIQSRVQIYVDENR